ncbi:MAG: bifunctional DNA-formamidopyrimidine glycosylase/DNA-(apurinic or apyrimidinic site) lyase [Gemmatimonadota bacterium]
MPELPEVETIARELHARLSGRSIREVRVQRPDVLRETDAEHLASICRGRSVERVWRRAKSAILSMSGGWHLLVQPRFTGSVLVAEPSCWSDGSTREATGSTESGETGKLDAPVPDEYATVVWELEDTGRFWYRDVRRLGTVTLADDAGLAAYDARIGIEPLDLAFDTARLSGLLRGSRAAIKKVLMDQRVLAGVGNIYANEALWRAGIDPSREARALRDDEIVRLHDALTAILAASIQARGTTFRDYRDPSNRAGGFAAQLLVYGLGGTPCASCGARLVETHAIDGRSTVFCHRCQR